MKRFPFLAVALVVFSAAPAPPGSYPARVVGISDGDTLTVLAAGNRQVKIRLHGIDCPETGQDFGARAKQAASELAFGQVVTILPGDTDRGSKSTTP
ncbi:thermonuclease family protein [Singulisphaera sp. PoT]|uniref:thermonuclease family protein n=1 Tax=Singulisphaera sp. PoT TaxID=3411797 RepID=UPI003BF4FF96